MHRTVLGGALAAALLIAAPPPAGASDRSESARRGAEWIIERQEDNGAFFAPDAQPHHVAETLIAVVAGGVTGEPVDRALAYIESKGPEAADTAGEAGLLVMGIVAGDEDPHDFGGENYVEHIQSFYDSTTGAYDDQLFQHSLAMLGRAASGDGIPAGALDYLAVNQCTNGGFSWQLACTGAPDVDTTAIALSALVAGERVQEEDDVGQARDWLLDAQAEDGGFEGAGAGTSANSTGLALAALAALGEDARAAPWRQDDGDDPVDALLALQHSSGGFLRNDTAAEPDSLSTRQAVPGMASRSYPVFPSDGGGGTGGGGETGGSGTQKEHRSIEKAFELSTARATLEAGPSATGTPIEAPTATASGEDPGVALGDRPDERDGRSALPIAGAGAAVALAAGLVSARAHPRLAAAVARLLKRG